MNMARKNLIYFIVHTAVGVIIVLLALLGVLGFNEDFANGVIWGASSGFIVTGILGIVSSLRLMRNPKKARMAEMAKNEERNVMIRTKTHASIFYVSLYSECAAVLITAFTGFKEVSVAFAILIVLQIICYIAFATYYSKKY